MNNIFVGSTLCNDPHTAGLLGVSNITNKINIKSYVLEPSSDYKELYEFLYNKKPKFLGLSYRLTPEIGYIELLKLLYKLRNYGLIDINRQKIAFSGLPKTLKIIRDNRLELPFNVTLIDSIESNKKLFNFFGVDYFHIHKNDLSKISILDDISNEVIKSDYMSEPPLKTPSEKAKITLENRILESNIPLLRVHFGIPSDTIDETVEGIKEISNGGAVDIISLGSSNLSQRYYGFPELFKNKNNDGGVPYKNKNDLKKLFNASRRGNYPAMKPYAHVNNMVSFIDECLDVGMLRGCQQAIPLFWFNELDGRGEKNVLDSLYEHFEAVKKLSKYNIPVEMNDPNQWSSRWAHDTVVVTSFGLISAVMYKLGVKEVVLQMMFGEPKESSDISEISKMKSSLNIHYKLKKLFNNKKTYIQTRTGLMGFPEDINDAKKHLSRSTLLQLIFNPHIIHIVNYCEANNVANVDDVIESSKIVKRTIRVFNKNKQDILKEINKHNDIISRRVEYLNKESLYLFKKILNLNNPVTDNLYNLCLRISPEILNESLLRNYMTAPGIISPKYKSINIKIRSLNEFFYDSVKVNNYNEYELLNERDRIT